MAEKTNAEILELARQRARQFGKPMPATRADVERLTGFFYTGPDPLAIGRTVSVPVRQVK